MLSYLSSTRQEIATYAFAIAIACLLTYYSHDLRHANLRVPFAYGVSDELTVETMAKWLIENPWIYHNERLGAPFGLVMFDWPQPEILYYMMLKLVGSVTRDFAVTINLCYLATFPATAASMLYLVRQIGITRSAAAVAALLYAFMPYHFLRGESHLFLAAYQFLPLAGLLTVRLATRPSPFLRMGSARRPRFQLTGNHSAFALVVAILIGSSGTYYAFFACFFFLLAGLAGVARQRSVVPLYGSCLCIAAVGLTQLLCVAPYLLYGHGHLAARATGDAELYGLKIAQLLLPITNHRLPALAAFKANYSSSAPLVNENDFSSLGIVAGTGFLCLLIWLGLRCLGTQLQFISRERQRLFDLVALLCFAATLLGSIGGFGSLFAVLVSPQIRGYSRISIFIALWALLAFAVLLESLQYAAAKQPWRVVSLGIAPLVLVFGLFDQTTSGYVPVYSGTSTLFRTDHEFVSAIETRLSPGSRVFQLPYSTFPYAARYDLLKGYLHSHTLRWSYGAMIGSTADAWLRRVSNAPAEILVNEVALAGFDGIYVDRNGYADNGASLEQSITKAAAVTPLASANDRQLFFDLRPYIRRRLGKVPSADEPVVIYPIGFYEQERAVERTWRWCASDGEMDIVCSQDELLTLEMQLIAGEPKPATVRLSSKAFTADVQITGSGTKFARQLTLPKGTTTIQFHSDAQPLHPPGDPRTLSFRVENVRLSRRPR